MIERRLKDAVYGLAIGDACGVPFEFKERGSFIASGMTGYGTHFQPEGTWSDDTSMALAICDSIREQGRIDCVDIRKKFRAWIDDARYTANGVVFDFGATTYYALQQGKGLNGPSNKGNGSIMRAIPLAFTDATDEEVGEVSAITHSHVVVREGCQYYIQIAKKLLEGRELADILRDYSHITRGPYERLSKVAELREVEIDGSGYVASTLEAALWAVVNSGSFKDAILRAVNLGDDTDTVAAVAGGLAGIIYGIEGMPADWVDTLRNKELIDSCLF